MVAGSKPAVVHNDGWALVAIDRHQGQTPTALT